MNLILLLKSYIQANEKSSGFRKGAYRDGVKREETSQGWDWTHFMTWPIVRPSETPIT